MAIDKKRLVIRLFKIFKKTKDGIDKIINEQKQRKYFLMVYLLFLIFNIIYSAFAAEEFLCEKFYGGRNVLDKLDSISTNAQYKLIVLNVSNYRSLTFEKAQEICRYCLNGTLVVQDDVTQIENYVPTWIGVQNRPNEHPTITSGWEWVDGSGPLNKWQLNFASRIDMDARRGSKRFGILAANDDERHSMSTALKWIAMGTDKDAEFEFEHDYHNYGYGLRNKKIKHLICRRPVQNSCQYWNYTEDACMTNPVFGCHNYINIIYQPSDNNSIHCEVPRHKRVALKCPCDNCTCAVSEWSQWSSCGEEQCTRNKTYRTRSRAERQPCPFDYVHQKLIDQEECEIPGCKELLASEEDGMCRPLSTTRAYTEIVSRSSDVSLDYDR